MKFLSAQDEQVLIVSKYCLWKNLLDHDSNREKTNGSLLTFEQSCWVMTNFWSFEKGGPTRLML